MATFEHIFSLINWNSIQWATTGSLPTYASNPVALTASSNGAMPNLDGAAISLGDEILVKNETGGDLPNNGHFFVTQLGDGSNPWILQRVASPETGLFEAERLFTVKWRIQKGTVNAKTEWAADVPANMGFSDITVEKHNAPSGSNVGGQVEVFSGTLGASKDLQYRTLSGSGGIVVSQVGDTVDISGSIGGAASTSALTYLNLGASGFVTASAGEVLFVDMPSSQSAPNGFLEIILPDESSLNEGDRFTLRTFADPDGVSSGTLNQNVYVDFRDTQTGDPETGVGGVPGGGLSFIQFSNIRENAVFEVYGDGAGIPLSWMLITRNNAGSEVAPVGRTTTVTTTTTLSRKRVLSYFSKYAPAVAGAPNQISTEFHISANSGSGGTYTSAEWKGTAIAHSASTGMAINHVTFDTVNKDAAASAWNVQVQASASALQIWVTGSTNGPVNWHSKIGVEDQNFQQT